MANYYVGGGLARRRVRADRARRRQQRLALAACVDQPNKRFSRSAAQGGLYRKLTKRLQERARALGVEFADIKAQNRRAHGLSGDGTPLPRAAPESDAQESAAPVSGGQIDTE
jgi:hypothetical protein